MSIQPIQFIRPNICLDCSLPTIELYNTSDKPMNYSLLCMMRDNKDRCMEYINRHQTKCFRCTKCGKEFPIKWEDGYFPIPFRDELNLTYYKNFTMKFGI